MPVTFKVVGSEVEIIKSFIFKRVIVVLYGLTVFENGCDNSGVRFYVFLLDLKAENKKILFSLFFLFFMKFFQNAEFPVLYSSGPAEEHY